MKTIGAVPSLCMKTFHRLWTGTLLGAATLFAQAQTTPETAATLPTVQTTVTVNATLNSETPASITVLNQLNLSAIAGTEFDDRLRQVAGFSLFRRSSSLVSNPTTQGLSLRGVGSSGASRTLVLWDGVPLNDPFGGWVYWDRLDPNYIDRVEVARGASTSVFGDRAMTGTLSVFSPPEKTGTIRADVVGGSDSTVDASAGYSNLWGHWGLSVDSRGLTTDGYYITPEPVRGSVDRPANVHFITGDLHLDYLGEHDRVAIRADVLAEERTNGTALTKNSTSLGTISGRYTHLWAHDEFSFIAFHTQGQYHSNFSSVSADRDSERLTSLQRVPEQDVGGAAYWQHQGADWHAIGGADVDDIHGTSFDYSFATSKLTPNGGKLLQHGVFGEGDYTFGAVRFFGGIRHQYTGQHGETFISPNVGASVALGKFRLRGSIYKSFRAPTLNELYRPFRVGNAQTLANANLLPEELTGYETGVDWNTERTHVVLTVFRNSLSNLIDNATLSTSPTLIRRQRENFPSALSRGIETSVDHRWRALSFQAAYLFSDTRLSTGQRIPEVPKQQGTAQLLYAHRATLLSIGLRSYGLQYDDDLNQFRLPGYTALALTGQRKLTAHLAAVASVENLLDRSYLVALTPTPNTGEPRLWRVGLRWNGPISAASLH